MYWSCSQVVLIRAESFRDSPASAFLSTYVSSMCISEPSIPLPPGVVLAQLKVVLSSLGILYKARLQPRLFTAVYQYLPFIPFPYPLSLTPALFHTKTDNGDAGGGNASRALCIDKVGARKGGVT